MESYIRSLVEGAVSLTLIGSFSRTKERIQGVSQTVQCVLYYRLLLPTLCSLRCQPLRAKI